MSTDPPRAETGAETFDVFRLAERVRALHSRRQRRVLLGIVGPPGAGKSTVAELLVAELGQGAVLVPMDGYHYSNVVLRDLGRSNRKGAPDTFDVDGYVALLRRLRENGGETVLAPAFDRKLDEPVADAISIPGSATIVVTEGNYLLTRAHGWDAVRPQLDEVWYVDVDPALRRSRLALRHATFGKHAASAEAWANGPDEANAVIVARSRGAADLIVSLS